MALFKILNNFDSGAAITSVTNYVQGYCYFDKTTGKFWIDTTNASSGRLSINGTYYGVCESAASASQKFVNCSGFVLSNGAIVFVHFTTTNTALSTSLTLNVNSTGPYPIKYKTGYLPSDDVLETGKIYGFAFDGQYYNFIGDIDQDTTYPALTTALVNAGTDTSQRTISAKLLIDTIRSFGYSTTTGTVTSVDTGAGLNGGPITTSGTIKLNLYSETLASVASAPGTSGDTNRLYSVGLDSTGKLAVNVPWTDNNTTYSNATQSAAGLMSAADKIKLDSIGSTPNIAVGIGLASTTSGSTATLKTKLRSETALTIGSQNASVSGTKVYAIQTDKDGYLAVSVPWTDNNTTYTNATQNVAGLMSPEDKRKLDSLYEADGTGTVKSISAGIGLTTASGSAITQSGTIKAKLKDEVLLSVASQTATANANRTYAVVGDKDGYLSVVVPWTDSPTTFDALTTSLIATGTDTTNRLISAKVLKDALDNYIAATDAMIFKGTLGTGGTITSLPTTHNAGWTYRVITEGDYAGQHAEIGDLIICITDGTSANNGHWTVAQTNIDGAVIGPSSATSNNVALFDGTTGKLIKDSGFTIGKSVPSNAVFTDTDTKVTSVTNHYTPAADANAELTGSLSGNAGGYALNTEYTVLTGVNIQRDAKGHVTGVSYTAQKIKDTDTTYSSKAASNGGTDVSLVTTGEKYLWNSKTSNTGTVTSIGTGVGLTGGTITNSGTIKVKLKSETALTADSTAATETAGRIYPIVPDKSGNLAVVVPWTDTNTQTVTGVKGNEETNYRTGNINITLSNIGAAAATHTHGNITNDGKIESVGITLAGGDALLFADSSNNWKIEKSSIAIGTGTTKYLREDGVWETPADTHWTTRLHAGTGSAANAAAENGNVKLTVSDNNTARTSVTIQGSGTTTVTSNAGGVITINSADQYVGTVTSIATGVGLTGGTISSSGTIKAKLKSETALTSAAGNPTNTADRTYPVAVDSSGNLAVNIPWTDNNTTYGSLTTDLINTGTDTAQRTVSAKVFKDALTNYIAANDAMLFKGTIGTGGTVTALPDTHNAGWTYRVITAGTYAGATCEIGDLIICIKDGTSANDAHWTVAQTNIDGAVVGPASATDGTIAAFDGPTGKIIKSVSPTTATVIKTVSLSGGATPTTGTAFSIPNVTGNSDVSASKVTKADLTVVTDVAQAASTSSIIATVANGVLTIGQAITAVGAVTTSTDTANTVSITNVTASKVTLGTAFSVPNITGVGSMPTLSTTTQTVVTGFQAAS